MSTAEARRNVEADISMLTSEGVPRAVAAGFMHGVISAVEVFEEDDAAGYGARDTYHKAAERFLAKWRALRGFPV